MTSVGLIEVIEEVPTQQGAQMSTARKATLVIIGLVAVIVAVVFLSNNTPNQNTAATVTIETFTQEHAEYLEEKLNSSSKGEQALALVPAMRAGEWNSAALFPEGAVLEIDNTSFEGDDENGHTVRSVVVLDEKVLDMFVLYIVYNEPEEKWLVGGTTKVEGE